MMLMFFEVTRCYNDRTIHWRYADDGDAIAMTLAITLNLFLFFESHAVTVRACVATLTTRDEPYHHIN